MPEYLLRFVAWIITRCVYRFKVTGDDNIPTTGAAILACNHVSFIDAVLLLAASPRPIYFVMDHDAMVRPFRRGMFSRVGLRVGTQLPAHEVRPEVLHAHVADLLARA